jgi:spore coat protein U-like protein
MIRRLTITALFLLVFGVQLVAAQSCSAYASGIAFGSYTGITSNTTGSVTVTCTSGTTYSIGLSTGMASGATVTSRAMIGPSSALLSYKLFSDATYTSNWGDTSGSGWVSGTGTGSAQPYTIHAQISAGQLAVPGNYTDTITVTVTY